MYNIFFKLAAAFPYNHSQNNRQQQERNDSCCHDFHKSSGNQSVENFNVAFVKGADERNNFFEKINNQ